MSDPQMRSGAQLMVVQYLVTIRVGGDPLAQIPQLSIDAQPVAPDHTLARLTSRPDAMQMLNDNLVASGPEFGVETYYVALAYDLTALATFFLDFSFDLYLGNASYLHEVMIQQSDEDIMARAADLGRIFPTILP